MEGGPLVTAGVLDYVDVFILDLSMEWICIPPFVSSGYFYLDFGKLGRYVINKR
jgi:hypothetical protein